MGINVSQLPDTTADGVAARPGPHGMSPRCMALQGIAAQETAYWWKHYEALHQAGPKCIGTPQDPRVFCSTAGDRQSPFTQEKP